MVKIGVEPSPFLPSSMFSRRYQCCLFFSRAETWLETPISQKLLREISQESRNGLMKLHLTSPKRMVFLSNKSPYIFPFTHLQATYLWHRRSRGMLTQVVSCVTEAPEGQRFIPSPMPQVSFAPMHLISGRMWGGHIPQYSYDMIWYPFISWISIDIYNQYALEISFLVAFPNVY